MAELPPESTDPASTPPRWRRIITGLVGAPLLLAALVLAALVAGLVWRCCWRRWCWPRWLPAWCGAGKRPFRAC